MKARFVAVVGAWSALVAGALVAVPFAYRDRLPDPLATHWGPSGDPDGAMAFGWFVVVSAVPWMVAAGVSLARLTRSGNLGRRFVRWQYGAVYGWLAGFLLGLQSIAIQANLDRVTWKEAGEVGWQVALVLTGALLAGVIGAALAGLGPDKRPARRPVGLPSGGGLRLEAGQTAVWVSSVSAPWAFVLAVAALGAALTLAVGALVGLPGVLWAAAAPLAVVGLAGLSMTSVRVKVSPTGLAVAFGPLRWPSRKVPLRDIERAWVEVRMPSEVGGWGIRGLPGAVTIMVRGGECLVVRYASGGQFAVSVDDASHGAALLNALVQGQVSA